jgi:DNA-directed RNA polymerase subunit RPC12/RpoP
MNLRSEAKARRVTCPYCGSSETELFSLFGQQLLTAQYYCRTCHTPFEYIKDDTMLGTPETPHMAAQSPSEPAEKRKETTR